MKLFWKQNNISENKLVLQHSFWVLQHQHSGRIFPKADSSHCSANTAFGRSWALLTPFPMRFFNLSNNCRDHLGNKLLKHLHKRLLTTLVMVFIPASILGLLFAFLALHVLLGVTGRRIGGGCASLFCCLASFGTLTCRL